MRVRILLAEIVNSTVDLDCEVPIIILYRDENGCPIETKTVQAKSAAYINGKLYIEGNSLVPRKTFGV